MFPNPKKALCALWVSMLICFKGFSHTPGFCQMGSNIDQNYYRCSWHANTGNADKATGSLATIHFVTVRHDGGAIAIAKLSAAVTDQSPIILSNNICGSLTPANHKTVFLSPLVSGPETKANTVTIPSGTYVMQLKCAEQYRCCTTDFIPALNSYEERLPFNA
ncbi:hypothetical protein HHL16_06470 [Pseudoflavitalea sp. G-6-1-2]|uniref:hypothetical protein n=1 Tax=Pseudoflavitalea sp. G-6-1-2 TaxID=2728841 RepID=UPI00146DFE93|nr:hypothetical protein [Pseudoflavitalea sp. G-6-1-2]NML20509.1 hypothetical protein [Pseudoflavitalea sp. G-6-1-2]